GRLPQPAAVCAARALRAGHPHAGRRRLPGQLPPDARQAQGARRAAAAAAAAAVPAEPHRRRDGHAAPVARRPEAAGDVLMGFVEWLAGAGGCLLLAMVLLPAVWVFHALAGDPEKKDRPCPRCGRKAKFAGIAARAQLGYGEVADVRYECPEGHVFEKA